jgi:hypothetical protein
MCVQVLWSLLFERDIQYGACMSNQCTVQSNSFYQGQICVMITLHNESGLQIEP